MADKTVKYEYVIYEQKGSIAYITLNRPERLNALGSEIDRDVTKCWHEIDGNMEVRVAIITGTGTRAFSAGMDVREDVEMRAQGKLRAYADPDNPRFGLGCCHEVVHTPLIAALNGLAVASGLELAMLADFRVMADHATIADLHGNVNVGGIKSLAWFLPWGIANYVTMTSNRLSAQECLQYGFACKVVPAAELMPTATRLAEQVCQMNPESTRELRAATIKLQIASGLVHDPEREKERLASLKKKLDEMGRTGDFLERQRAFIEKRGKV